MQKLPFYIVTSDATSGIVPATAHLYNQYWKPEGGQQFTVLGNHAPKERLPENFSFVQVKHENNIQKWTRYLHDYIAGRPEDYFIMTLDDYMPNAPLSEAVLERLLLFAKNHPSVGRISLARLDVERWKVAESLDNYDIVTLTPDSPYRLSCQTSVWKKEYFLKYYQHDWTPWQLELEGSRLARHDGWDIAGTNRAWAFGWVEESALSGRWPGMVNILGMRPDDVRYCLEQKWFAPETLQYGIWYDCRIPLLSRFQNISKKFTVIPKFSDIGYRFSWRLIRPYVRTKTLKRLLFRYKHIYPDS